MSLSALVPFHWWFPLDSRCWIEQIGNFRQFTLIGIFFSTQLWLLTLMVFVVENTTRVSSGFWNWLLPFLNIILSNLYKLFSYRTNTYPWTAFWCEVHLSSNLTIGSMSRHVECCISCWQVDLSFASTCLRESINCSFICGAPSNRNSRSALLDKANRRERFSSSPKAAIFTLEKSRLYSFTVKSTWKGAICSRKINKCFT